MIPTLIYPALVATMGPVVGTRIYRDWPDVPGDEPQAPYVIWTVIAGIPENNLSNPPPIDRFSIGIDVFGRTAAEADELVKLARAAMEMIGHVETVQSLGRDGETTLWRYTFSADVWRNRTLQ